MKLPLFKIYWDEEDIKAIEDVIRSGSYWCTGKQIEEFEELIKEYLDAKYCLVFNSGGSALYSLMMAYDFKPGDEIIVPAFTFIATAYAPLYVGAKPVFADIEEKTFGLDPENVLAKITPKTKAIIPIHYGGMPCQIKAIKEIAEDHNLILIEDAAESFGSKFKNKFVGTFGDASIFSFCHNKVFTTSEGGCVITDNKEVYEKLKLIRSYGRVVSGDYFSTAEGLDYVHIGFNFRLSTLLASLGISQIKKVDYLIEMRRKNALYLNNLLSQFKNIITPVEPSKDYFAVYQMYTIRVLNGERDKLKEFLSNKGITTRIYFEPLYNYTIFRKYKTSLPVTDKISKEVLTLPFYPHISKDEIDYMVKSIEEFYVVEK